MLFHLKLESLCGATLMPHKVCDGLERNNIVRVGKKSGPVLSRLWTKVHEFFDNVGDPSCFQTHLPDCLLYFTFRSEDIRH